MPAGALAPEHRRRASRADRSLSDAGRPGVPAGAEPTSTGTSVGHEARRESAAIRISTVRTAAAGGQHPCRGADGHGAPAAAEAWHRPRAAATVDAMGSWGAGGAIC